MSNKNLSLTEATIKALYDDLPDDENVEGVIDDILVITDPEITSDEYDEIIEKAQEIVQDTPEGRIPFDEDYIGQYVQTCPRCGSTFVEKDLLQSGDTCPICLETPDGFVMKGKIESEDDVVENDTKETKTDVVNDTEINNDSKEETNSIDEEDKELEKQVASKELPQGNKLQEGKLEEENEQYSTTCINNTIEEIENLINVWTENLAGVKERFDNETDEKEKENLQKYMDMTAKQLDNLEKDLSKWKNIKKSEKIDESNLTESIPGMDIFEHQDEYPEIDLTLFNSEAQEAIIFIENNINKLTTAQLHELADKVYMEDINTVKEFMKYLVTSDNDDIIEIAEELKKYISEEVEESFNKETKILNEEDTSFQEIVDIMMNAEDYSDLYAAAELIKDSDLKEEVTTMITDSEEDEDEVSVAASIITTDLLDNKIEENIAEENYDILLTDKIFQNLKEMEDFIEDNNFDILDINQKNEEITITDITQSNGIQEIYKYEEQPDSTFKIIKKIREI